MIEAEMNQKHPPYIPSVTFRTTPLDGFDFLVTLDGYPFSADAMSVEIEHLFTEV
jgi:hypothetical protein